MPAHPCGRLPPRQQDLTQIKIGPLPGLQDPRRPHAIRSSPQPMVRAGRDWSALLGMRRPPAPPVNTPATVGVAGVCIQRASVAQMPQPAVWMQLMPCGSRRDQGVCISRPRQYRPVTLLLGPIFSSNCPSTINRTSSSGATEPTRRLASHAQ